MLALRCPREAYRRIGFDARVGVADPRELVTLCYEQLIGALGTARFAEEAGDNRLKSRSLTRALSAITALQLGISASPAEAGMAAALRQLYTAARKSILDSALAFDPARIGAIRQDFIDIAAAFGTARAAA